MSLDTAIDAIKTRGDALWPGIEPTVPIAWDGETDTFDRPYDMDGTPKYWLLIERKWNGGGFVSIGAPGDNLARREGHIWIHAFGPRGRGASRKHQLVARAASMFEGADFSGVVCQAMEPGGDADDEDGNFTGQSVAIPFDFDETA